MVRRTENIVYEQLSVLYIEVQLVKEQKRWDLAK